MATLIIDPDDVKPITFVAPPFTGPAGEDIYGGYYVRYDTTTGKIMMANASDAANAGDRTGYALRTALTGSAVSVQEDGELFVGDTALDAMSFDDPVYLSDTDGLTADAQGSTAVIVGRVVPQWGDGTSTPQKIIRVKRET